MHLCDWRMRAVSDRGAHRSHSDAEPWSSLAAHPSPLVDPPLPMRPRLQRPSPRMCGVLAGCSSAGSRVLRASPETRYANSRLRSNSVAAPRRASETSSVGRVSFRLALFVQRCAAGRKHSHAAHAQSPRMRRVRRSSVSAARCAVIAPIEFGPLDGHGLQMQQLEQMCMGTGNTFATPYWPS